MSNERQTSSTLQHPGEAGIDLAVPRTRLATILADLHQRAFPTASEAEGGSSTSDVSIGEILERTRLAGFGFIVALLALFSIPLVGLTVPFGLAVAAAGVQMVAGRSQPWLPRFLRRRRISLAALRSLSGRTERWTRKMSRLVRPRLTWLTAGPFWTLCGAALVVQGLSLTLPVPGADWLFVVPIVLYGIGLLEDDGLLILMCHALTLVQIVTAVLLWELIARGFSEVYAYCVSTMG